MFIRLHGPCTDGDSGKFGIKLCAPCQHKRYMLRCVCFFFLWKKLSSSLLLVDEMRTIGLGRFRCFIFLYIDRCSMLMLSAHSFDYSPVLWARFMHSLDFLLSYECAYEISFHCNMCFRLIYCRFPKLLRIYCIRK